MTLFELLSSVQIPPTSYLRYWENNRCTFKQLCTLDTMETEHFSTYTVIEIDSTVDGEVMIVIIP